MLCIKLSMHRAVASTVALQSKGPGQDKGLPVPAWILSKYSGFLQ